jgi:hypothetical protein
VVEFAAELLFPGTVVIEGDVSDPVDVGGLFDVGWRRMATFRRPMRP